MKCFICNNKMENYFTKTWGEVSGNFVRCPKCGLVVNKTMYDMETKEWEKANCVNHELYQGSSENAGDPHWVERVESQAQLIYELYENEIFKKNDKVVDYGCGDAKLSFFLDNLYNNQGKHILNYDKYMCAEGYLSEKDMNKMAFDVVITCSVFEHLLGKGDVDEIFSYITPRGVFCLHTLICEEVPQDSDWFYLFPVHCTLWTNKAMSILFKQKNFVGCAYHVVAKMWFFFRDKEQFELLKNKAGLFTGEWVFSDSFVDYWKQKPYRN